jgi:demethylmenaquinone methyltransferase/2-methoxy-6-polyprenyl-1,4-benzoquinol methylase
LNKSAQQSKDAAIGAAPEGAADSASSARAIRAMFTSIAPRYDLLNHLLSFNVDRLWRKRAAHTFAHILGRPHSQVLDLCCGTGDLALALGRGAGREDATIIGTDFSHAMLQRATFKSTGTGLRWIEADALSLPFPDSSFDLVTAAFGFRNLANYETGLREIVRVLRPGGECGILEFGEPAGILGKIYRLYFKRLLPAVGVLISGVKGPYSYLPASVERFPSPENLLESIHEAGFREASWQPYTLGIAGLYRAKK